MPGSEPAPPSALRQSSPRSEAIRAGPCMLGPNPTYIGGIHLPACNTGTGAPTPSNANVGPLLRGLPNSGGSQPPGDGSTHHVGVVPVPYVPQSGPPICGEDQTGAIGFPSPPQQSLWRLEGVRLPSPRPKRRRH